MADSKTKAQLQAELAEAKAELANVVQPTPASGLNNDLMTEMAKLKRGASINPNSIPVKSIDDHVNVVLWTPLNKKIGGLHPHNAEKTMQRWYMAGIPLYTSKRTPEQVEQYKLTPEYAQRHKAHLKLRAKRHRNTDDQALEKMSKIIAKQTGQAIKDMNVATERE